MVQEVASKNESQSQTKNLKDLKQVTRLMKILNRLNNGEVLSISELSKQYGVCTRTIVNHHSILESGVRDFMEFDGNFYPVDNFASY